MADLSDADRWRHAQANRLIRFCEEQGVKIADVMSGKISVDLTAILGPDGTIQPEETDFLLVHMSEIGDTAQD